MTLAVDDRYATGVPDRPAIVDRTEPVTWGEVTSPELIDYATRGYVQVDNALSPGDVAACLREIERIEHDERLSGDRRIVRARGSSAVRSIGDVRELSPIVAAAVELSGARLFAREILGSDVYVHCSRLDYAPGFRGEPSCWHSDFATWRNRDSMHAPRAVTASISLTRNETYNGPLLVSPGSHRRVVPCGDEMADVHFEASPVPSEDDVTAIVDEFGIDVLTGPAGSMTMFDCNVLHASQGNISPVPRAELIVAFNSVENRSRT